MELSTSGLPDAIHKLTSEMVDHARIKALLSETDTIAKHFKEFRSVQRCVPLSYSSPFLTYSPQTKTSRGKANQGRL